MSLHQCPKCNAWISDDVCPKCGSLSNDLTNAPFQSNPSFQTPQSGWDNPSALSHASTQAPNNMEGTSKLTGWIIVWFCALPIVFILVVVINMFDIPIIGYFTTGIANNEKIGTSSDIETIIWDEARETADVVDFKYSHYDGPSPQWQRISQDGYPIVCEVPPISESDSAIETVKLRATQETASDNLQFQLMPGSLNLRKELEAVEFVSISSGAISLFMSDGGMVSTQGDIDMTGKLNNSVGFEQDQSRIERTNLLMITMAVKDRSGQNWLVYRIFDLRNMKQCGFE